MKTIMTFLLSIVLLSGQAWSATAIDETRDVSPTAKVVIENDHGEMSIEAWDKPLFTVKGTIDDNAEGYELKVRGNKVVFEVDYPNSYHWKDDNHYKGTKLTMYVPKGVDLRVEGVNGGLSVQGIEGTTKAETVNGDITVSKLKNRVRVKTVNGDIDSSELNGKLKLETVNGSIEDKASTGEVNFRTVNGSIQSDSDFSEVRIKNVNGDIELDLVIVEDLEITTVNGDVDAKLALADSATVQAKTVGGDVKLVLPLSLNANVDVNTHSGGEILNRLTDAKVVEPKYGPKRSLEFAIGNGDASIEITTVSGDVELRPGKVKSLK